MQRVTESPTQPKQLSTHACPSPQGPQQARRPAFPGLQALLGRQRRALTAGARTLTVETLRKHYFVFDLGHSIVVPFLFSSVIVVVFNVIIISIKVLGFF